MAAKALWYVGKKRAELRDEAVAAPAAGELRVRARFGAVSRGTERLIFEGRVPESEFERMRAPFMGGAFPHPVKYGYSIVGTVEEGPQRGRTVFVLHPHQSAFVVPETAAAVVPDNVPPQRAVLAANMETALNAVWDGAPGPADRIAIVGGGVVGMLVARLCARMPGTQVTVVDVSPERGDAGARFGRGLRHTRQGARKLRRCVPRQRQRRRSRDRAAHRGRREHGGRAELVRQRRGRGAARRGVP